MASFILVHELERGIGDQFDVITRLINVDMIKKIWIPPAGTDMHLELLLIGDEYSMRLQESHDELAQKLQAAGASVN